jgi:sugar phosphate isomerase/epimerase
MKDIRLCDSGELDYTKELCSKFGYGIEFQTFHDPNIKDLEKEINNHKRILSIIPGAKSLHAPFWELNLGTKMPGIRKVTMDMFNYAYHIAKQLGCTHIVVHNGYIPGTSPIEYWVKRAALFWKDFFKDKDDSITMCVENQFELDSEVIIKEIDTVNDERLKCCLDTGHAHGNSNMSVYDWISTLGSRIGYFHLHNNHGKQDIKGHNNDEHLGLTDGTIDMDKVFKLIDECCPNAIITIESKPEYFADSIKWLEERK